MKKTYVVAVAYLPIGWRKVTDVRLAQFIMHCTSEENARDIAEAEVNAFTIYDTKVTEIDVYDIKD